MIKSIITTLDNLQTLKEQIPILRQDPLIDGIVVVNNGSIDGTREWLDAQNDLTVIHHDNNYGPSMGRNAGLDKANKFDYVLMLDGGIRPLHNGTMHMLNYMERHKECDVLGVEIPHMITDRDQAWHRWPRPITDGCTYVNTRLSHTAYCLARYKAFDGIRFCVEGPFGKAGAMAEDDELAYQWQETGISVHVVTNIHPYRHASGSFRRLYQETGIWPNQYGSVYEQRVVWLHQNWPQYEPVGQWGEPWLTVVIKYCGIEATARMIKYAHDRLRERRYVRPYSADWNPYHIQVWGDDEEWLGWAEARRLRQHHGDTIIVNSDIIRRNKSNEDTWTGDFILNVTDDWEAEIRPGAFYYGLAEKMDELESLIDRYDQVYPRQPIKTPPNDRGKL